MQERFSVPDVSCDHCKHAIEGALNPLEGVSRAEVDVEARSVSVDYDPTEVERARLLEVLDEEGYPVAV